MKLRKTKPPPSQAEDDHNMVEIMRALDPERAGHADSCHHWEWGPCNCGWGDR